MPGLQLYNGAFSDDSQQYAQKVMAEKERMQQMLRRSRPAAAARGSVFQRPDRNLPSRRTPSCKSLIERV